MALELDGDLISGIAQTSSTATVSRGSAHARRGLGVEL